MINIPPIKQSTAVKTDLVTNITQTWKVGQVLNATTQRGGDALSNVLIRVGQHTIEAKTPITLQDGQDIKLLVKSLGQFQSANQTNKLPLLNIIETQATAPETNKLAALKLRQFIAIQQTFSQVQQTAHELLSNNIMTAKLPASLKHLLNNLQQTLQLNENNITPAQLKQKILNSGIFLESKLRSQTSQHNSENNLVRDFKYQLLAIKSELLQFLPERIDSKRPLTTTQQLNHLQVAIKQLDGSLNSKQLIELIDRLTTTLPRTSLNQLNLILNSQKPDILIPDELQALAKSLTVTLQQHGKQPLQEQLNLRLILLDLGQQIEQSISKITSLQLQPMSREGDNLVLLLFNLIFKDRHERFDIDFRIQQENKETEENEQSWSVILSFNFKTLGKVQSKIHLVGNQVSSTFHTEYRTTADKIKQLLPLLETGLTNAGLNIVNLSVDNKQLENKPFISTQVNLLDEKA